MTGSDTQGETYLPSQLGLHGIIDGSLRLSFSRPGSPCKILMGYCLLSLSFPICIPARTFTNQLCEEYECSEKKVLGPTFLKVCYSSMGGYISSMRIFFFFGYRTYQNLDYANGSCGSPGKLNRKPFPDLFKSFFFFFLEHFI